MRYYYPNCHSRPVSEYEVNSSGNLFNRFRIKCGMTVVFILIIHILLTPIYAYNPDLPNNKFGIHLAQPHLEDLQKAKELINSSGGDWGYVTLVIQENDRDKNKWQEIFDLMRGLHLIPIIRLATVPEADRWRRPAEEDADSWAEFLNSLHWVVKEHYIILFNEPNHGSEWGGEVDAQNYTQVALTFAQKLKEKSPEFFIMLAGLDASAPNSLPRFQDEADFLNQFFNNTEIEQFNNLFSGFASHSYPNPGFSGSPYDFGRGSIRNYEWELNLLKQLGIKDPPVFITETGWRRGDETTIADYFKIAFDQIWLPDNRVVAVTPFVLDYQGEPFLNFSWKKFQNSDFYPQFYTVQSLSKTKGEPVQIEKGEIFFDFPKELVADSSFHFTVRLKNLGQAVWDKNFGYQLSVVPPSLEYFFADLKKIRPFEETDIDLYIKTNGTLGKRNAQIVLKKEDKEILKSDGWRFEVFPLPSLEFSLKLFPKFTTQADDFEIQVFNKEEELVLKRKQVKVKKGKGKIEEVQNVVLGSKYRVVILKPYYLPRQAFITFGKSVNKVSFEPMLPFDFSPNGKFDVRDFMTFLQNPKSLNLLFP